MTCEDKTFHVQMIISFFFVLAVQAFKNQFTYGYSVVQSHSGISTQPERKLFSRGNKDHSNEPPVLDPPLDINNIDDGKSLMDFHKLNYRLQEYLHSASFPEGPFKATVFPPKYVINDIEERISLATESMTDPPEGWETMERDDPRWLLAPLPKSGEADYEAAYLRHLRWRRRLGALELRLWSENAVYGLLDSVKSAYEYNLDDYINQRFLTMLENRAQQALEIGDEKTFKEYALLEMKSRKDDEDEIESVMNAYYAALNARDRSKLLSLWLPDANSELVLPGFSKARGVPQRMATYKTLNWETKKFGEVKPNYIKIESFGNIAFVHTIETVGFYYTTYSRAVSKGRPEPKPLYQKRIFATTVLRYFNKQWRIAIHHALRFRLSSLTKDLPEIKLPPTKKPTVTASSSTTATTTTSSIPAATSFVPKSINELIQATTVLPRDSSQTTTSPITRSLSNKNSIDYTSLPVSFSSSTSSTPFPETNNRFSERSIYPEGISVTKKAIITLRYLVQRKFLTKEEKDLLVNHMIDCIAADRKSNIETAFNILFGERPENLLKEAFDRSIEEFCDQCHEILQRLKDFVKTNNLASLGTADASSPSAAVSSSSLNAEEDNYNPYSMKSMSRIFRRRKTINDRQRRAIKKKLKEMSKMNENDDKRDDDDEDNSY